MEVAAVAGSGPCGAGEGEGILRSHRWSHNVVLVINLILTNNDVLDEDRRLVL
jgi:hypothetical protein